MRQSDLQTLYLSLVFKSYSDSTHDRFGLCMPTYLISYCFYMNRVPHSYILSRTSSAPTYQLIQDGERPLLETLPMCYRRLRLPWPLNTSAWAPCSMRREKSLPTTCSALLDIELMPARSKHQLECLRISVFHPLSMGGIRGGD